MTDAQASLLMEEGIRLLYSDDNVEAALICFDRALELRRRLYDETPAYAYALAACWLNRGEALTRLGPAHRAAALNAYDEALALLRPLPAAGDARFLKRLAIAHQNRALVLAGQDPPATPEAIAALGEALLALDCAGAMNAAEREYLRAIIWMNLANIHASAETSASDLAAWDAAQRALALVKPREYQDVASAGAGLKARHVLCHIAARRLALRTKSTADVHDATDLADEGLHLIRAWERRGINHFRNLESDLFRFGARVYATYQPHFLGEFLSERSHA